MLASHPPILLSGIFCARPSHSGGRERTPFKPRVHHSEKKDSNVASRVQCAPSLRWCWIQAQGSQFSELGCAVFALHKNLHTMQAQAPTAAARKSTSSSGTCEQRVGVHLISPRCGVIIFFIQPDAPLQGCKHCWGLQKGSSLPDAFGRRHALRWRP